MKVILQDSSNYVLRFDKGEEVIAGISKFMTDSAVSACAFFGIGACSSVELNYFNTHLKQYRIKPYVEDFEIISFTGNGAFKDGQPIVHSHAMFGRNDFSTIGGHVSQMVVSETCEIFLLKMFGSLERKLVPESNLNLLV